MGPKGPEFIDKITGLPDLNLPPLPNVPRVATSSLPSHPTLPVPVSPDSDGAKSRKKVRYVNGPYGRIQMHGSKVRLKGRQVLISNARQWRIFQNGVIEDKDGVNFVLTAETEDEAKSWWESFAYGGAEKEHM